MYCFDLLTLMIISNMCPRLIDFKPVTDVRGHMFIRIESSSCVPGYVTVKPVTDVRGHMFIRIESSSCVPGYVTVEPVTGMRGHMSMARIHTCEQTCRRGDTCSYASG
jgi:hypothetical protein